MMLPGRYKQRPRRRPRGTVIPCRACGRHRSRDEAAASTALGRAGLCHDCLRALAVPLVAEEVPA